jgi:hypothetical protein|tara:strand:+ start:439 stop:681 length:243 start_codon:yes stop_codon:yes gene_type:complete
MVDDLYNFLLVLGLIIFLLIVDYSRNRCPKCRTWHFFRRGLIILDKPRDESLKNWVKCKKCGHEWKKLLRFDVGDTFYTE